MNPMVDWLDSFISTLAKLAPAGTQMGEPLVIKGLTAVILVCLICGAAGSLVVGRRMAFFSDALAHCAFAGVGIGLLSALFLKVDKESGYYLWGIPIIMVGFGTFVGLAIAYVREKTALANDTVIGIFFAGAIGFGAMLFKALNTRSFMTPEAFLFGDPILVRTEDLLILFLLALLTLGVLAWIYNRLVFASFNPSLARSRRISMRLCNYVFLVLLALIVNLSLKTVGVLLINGLLIVPAATAANLSRNLRQMFWLSIGLSVLAGVSGAWLAIDVPIPDPETGKLIYFGWGGTIVVMSVLLFFVSMAVGPWVRGRRV